MVITDEWDAIFRESRYNTQAQKEYVELLRGLFKSVLSKRFIALAYMTGILPIKKYNSESALNNFDEFTMTSSAMLAEYVGFIEEEVKGLCKEYGMVKKQDAGMTAMISQSPPMYIVRTQS